MNAPHAIGEPEFQLGVCGCCRPRLPLPRDRARFARDYEAWLRRVGWRQ
jgi:hypothetical protein